MSNAGKLFLMLGCVLLILCIVLPIFFGATSAGKAIWNNWFHAVQKADDATNYETRKQVEDTCRAMIASYKADQLIYEQYRESESEEKRSWAEQAKMRANKTAVSYNEYVLKNSYVWEGNVPGDIDHALKIME